MGVSESGLDFNCSINIAKIYSGLWTNGGATEGGGEGHCNCVCLPKNADNCIRGAY